MKKQIGVDQSLARRYNSATILDHLRLHAPLSRASLAKYTGLTRSSVSRIVDELISENLIHEIGAQQEKIGRPGTLIELNPAGGAALGIEIGVDYISVILTDFIAQILWRRRVSLSTGSNLQGYLDAAEELIGIAINESASYGLQPLGIGVGVWGLVDIQKGEVRFAPNLKWHNVPLKQLWESRFGLTVFVDNEANAAAMGEYYLGSPNTGKNVDDLIYLSTGIGLGGGIISEGKVFRGWNGFAGEVGHMIIDPQGDTCMCGKKGCWETFVGSQVAVKNYKALTGSQVSFEELVHLLKANEPGAREVFTKMAMALGTGLGNLVDIFNPSCIIVGGALEQISNIILPIVSDSFSKSSLFQSFENIRIIPSALGSDSCVLGCVALVLDEVIRQRTKF